MRRVIDPPLNYAGGQLVRLGISADGITLTGFALGLSAAGFVAAGHYLMGLALLMLNRLADGLDGAVARQTRMTEFGGYLDIVCDFLVWALLPAALAIANPAHALPAALLLASFMGASTTFLAYAILAARHGHTTQSQGLKTIYYLEGLTEGTETILLFVLMLLFPAWIPVLAYIFAGMAGLTTVSRMIAAWRVYRR